MKYKYLLAIVIFTAIGIYSGYEIGKKNAAIPKDLKIKSVRTSQNGLINPLVEYEISSNFYTNELKPFKEDVQKYIDENHNYAKNVAVYFRSLNDGPWFGINQDDNFFPASLLKIPIMIAYFKLSENNPDILKKEITYDKEIVNQLGDFNEGKFFTAEKSIEEGKTYTVDELIMFMIDYSDNNAKNLLVLNLPDVNDLFRVYTDLGLTSPPELRGPGDILSVHEYSSIYRVLYNASYLNRDLSKKALGLLVKAKFPQGISAGIPNDIQIANKFGENTNGDIKQLHDCGIVYYPKNPYILCIMTRGKNFEDLETVIKNISRIVYDNVNNNPKN